MSAGASVLTTAIADPARVVIVEDDQSVCELVTHILESEGYVVRSLPSGLGLRKLTQTFRPQLAVLDVRLHEGPDGYQLARELRATSDVPLLFLTAADGVEDRLAGFQAGCDDYVTKPFSTRELVARIKALLRRSGTVPEESNTYEVDGLVVDELGRTASYNGGALELTRTEFDLLCAFAREPGVVLSKQRLLATVWGFDEYGPNLVEVHISSVRRKVEEHGPRIIQTVRGVGYVMRS